MLFLSIGMDAQYDWDNIAIPANAGNGKKWQLQETPSDDFNYNFNATSQNKDFGPAGNNLKWNNFYHNSWTGPGATVWKRNHVSVKNGKLNIWASRRFKANGEPYTKTFEFGGNNITKPETMSGCITSKTRVKFPVFIEASIDIMKSSLATDIWLLSPDDKEEIDIIECYGGKGNDNRNAFFAERIHLSHHVFNRPQNFRDYQPRDNNSWFRRNGVTEWGGRTVRIGVNWKSANVIEYYIDGRLERVLDDKAIATRLPNGTWQYTYPDGFTGSGINRVVALENGFQKMKVASTSSNFNQNNLNQAKNLSRLGVIDPFNYLGTNGRLSRELDIIINVEDQSWQAAADRSANDQEIKNRANNTLKVDWIRVYKPVNVSGGGGSSNNSFFYIENRRTRKFIRPRIDAENSQVVQAPRSFTGAYTQWEMVSVDNTYFHLKNKKTGKYLRPETTANNSPLIQTNTATKYNWITQWEKVNTNNGYFHLRSRWTYKYFKPRGNDDLGNQTGNNYGLQLVPNSSLDTQWKFNNVSSRRSVTEIVNTGDSKIETANQNEFHFYPNPASDIITIKTGTSNSHITIKDVTGKLVKSADLPKNSTQEISVSNLDSGIYLIEYKVDGKRVTKKMAIK